MDKSKMKIKLLYVVLIILPYVTYCQDYRKFIGNKVQVTHSTRLNTPFYYDNILSNGEPLKVSINADTLKKENSIYNLIISEEKNPFTGDTTSRHIEFSNELKFIFNLKEIIIVKYIVKQKDLVLKVSSKVFQKDIVWQEKQILELSNIQTTIQTLKPDSFWAFYNSDPSGIKEIDAIKAQFKDSEGILDIDKLGAYLKTKPPALAKYCDY